MSDSAVRPATRTHAGDGDAVRRRSGRVPLLTLLFSALLMLLVAACGNDARKENSQTPDDDAGAASTLPGAGSSPGSAGIVTGSGVSAASSTSTQPGAGRAAASGAGRATAAGPDYRIDAMINWSHFTSLKCGSPAGTWDLVVDGTFPLGGGTLVLTGRGMATLDAASLQGPWNAQYAVKLAGVPAMIGGQDGTVAGNTTLAGNVLQIRSQVGRGTFFSQTPAVELGGPADNPAKDFDLPVQNGRFC